MNLTPSQIARLEKVLQSGFRFITLERYGRYFGIERDGFAVLIDAAEGRLRILGQPGYLMGEGIGMLVDRRAEKTFVWHQESVTATPELLAAYDRFSADVESLLNEGEERQ